jgi:mono/diheme cytochrome c family protein
VTSKQSARRALAGVLLLGSSALSGCTDFAGYDLDRIIGSVPWLAVLREDVSYDPYEMPRLPADGSIPVASPAGDVPPPFAQTQLDSAAATLSNPLQPSTQVLARGKIQYDRNCAVCHGTQGAGNGTVVGPNKFPFAPPVNGANTAARSDGYLYAVIRVGRGLMPAYADRMTHYDRWAVVAYMRQLQGGAVAAPAAPPAAPAGTPPTAAPAADTAGGAGTR